MLDSFLSDLPIALFSAIATVGIAYFTYVFERRHRERQALRGLFNDLHHRRAVAPLCPAEDPGAAQDADFQRVSLSILDFRDHVRRVRDQIRPDSSIQISLTKMTAACNWYLDESEHDPDSYQFYLHDLREELRSTIFEISGRVRHLKSIEPGAAAY